MKKTITALLTIAALLACLAAGYTAGICHAVYSQELYIVEMPQMGADYFEVYSSLDGQVNSYLGYIG